MTTQENLKFELTPLSISLFNNNNKLRKPYKAEFGQSLRSVVESVKQETVATLLMKMTIVSDILENWDNLS